MLNEERIADIEDIVVRMYRGKVPDIKETLEKSREAIGKNASEYERKQEFYKLNNVNFDKITKQ